MEKKEILMQQYSSLLLDYVKYQKFMENEVENLLIKNGVKYQSIASRVKSIGSLSKKLDNGGLVKKLNGDIKNLNDLCGIRIILYDNKNLDIIRGIINDSFDIVEWKNQNISYNANNITVKLNNGMFKDFQCEIQLVTVMSHNLIEIGHDIIYKDRDNLEKLDPNGYEQIKEDYNEYLREIYDLETKVESIKKRAINIKESYHLFTKVVTDEYINKISNNNSMSEFYYICNDISSLAEFLSRNTDKAQEFLDKKVMVSLTKTIPNLNADGMFNAEFVFDNYIKLLHPYCNVWISDIDEIFNIIIPYLSEKKNNRMNESFFNMIKHIVTNSIVKKEWIIFSKIKDWVISNDDYPEFKIRILNCITNDSISYAEEVEPLKLNIITKCMEYNETGKEIITEIFDYCCNLFLKNQNRKVYDEFINFIYKFVFLANKSLDFFYNNYDQIDDIYKFDFIRKIYYSFKEVVLDDKYFKKLKMEGIYDLYKYLVYEHFDDELEKSDWRKAQQSGKRIINKYIKNINEKNIEELSRILRCYESLTNDNQQISITFEKFIYEVGYKYNNAKKLYDMHKNPYLYLGIVKSGKRVKKRNDIEIIRALGHNYISQVFLQLLKDRKNNIEKDTIFCKIILEQKLYKNKTIKNKMFKIIKYYNEKRKFLDNMFFSKEFIENISSEECDIILENYKYTVEGIGYYDINLMNIFKVYPQNYRNYIKEIIENKDIKTHYPIKVYITSCENYEKERKNNIVFILQLLKKYDYYEIYKYISEMYRFNDIELIGDLIEIIKEDNSTENLLAISKFLCKLEVGLKSWKVIRLILLETDDKEITKKTFNSFIDVGVVNSFVDTYKARVTELKDIRKAEKDKKLRNYLDGLINYYQSNIGVEELREFKYNSEMKLKFENSRRNKNKNQEESNR